MISLSLLGQRPLQPWQGTPVQQSQGAQIGENWRNQALEEQKRQGLARLGGLLQDPNANRGAIANELSRLGQTGQALDVAFPKVAGGADPEEIRSRLQSLQKSYLQVMGNGGFAEKIVGDKATDEDYKAFSEALDKNAEDAGMLVSMKVGPQSFKNWVLPDLQELKEKAYSRGIAGKKMTLAEEANKRAEAENKRKDRMEPIDIRYKTSQTKLAEKQEKDITRSIEAKVMGDADKYQSVMDEMASTANALLESIQKIKSGDSQLAKSAKADITKRVSRASSNEALSEADFARASGASNWKTVLDAVLKTDFAQMRDDQAINEAMRIINASKASYDLANQRAKAVLGGRGVIAMPFPSVQGQAPKQSQSQKSSAPTQGKAQTQQTAKPNPFARFKK